MLTKRTIVHLPIPKDTPAVTITPQSRSSSSTCSKSSSTMIPSPSFSSTPYHSMNTTNHNGANAEQNQLQTIKSSKVAIYGREFLVSDTLYFKVPQSIKDSDIQKLLATCRPLLIQRNEYQDHVTAGWIRFVNKEQADRAYTLFDGLVFQNSRRLQLYITPNGSRDQVPNAPIFQINDLCLSMTNEGLYNLFRPFGPIRLCKIIVEKDGSFNGTALLQYFDQQHAENAKKIMNNKAMDGDKQMQIHILFGIQQTINEIRIDKQLSKSSSQHTSNNTVDYTNLYIKNLDLAVKSADLYLVFKTFGHIISARVMKNPRTKQSRGYGFVSFTRPDDAKAALDQLNGNYILGKPVVIAYHEPKRHASPNPTKTPNTSISCHQHNSMIGEPSLPIGSNVTKNGKVDHRYYHASSPVVTITPTLVHTASETFNNLSYSPSSSISYGSKRAPPKLHEGNDRSKSQRDHVRTAILDVIRKTKGIDLSNLDDWVDHIMSLRPASRALCIFNPAYLVSKLEAIAHLPQKSVSPDTTSKTPNLIQPSDHHSHASSSSASSSAAPTTSTTDIVTVQDLDEPLRHSLIALFVESTKGLSLLQQKQYLGDLLFPNVKATGTKQASKVTIHLLDTQPLEQLAYSMYSMDLLRPLVDKAFLTLTRQQSFIKAVMKM